MIVHVTPVASTINHNPRNPVPPRWIGELVPVLVEAGLSSVQPWCIFFPQVDKCWNLKQHTTSSKIQKLVRFFFGGAGFLSFGEIFGQQSPLRDRCNSDLWYFVHDHAAMWPQLVGLCMLSIPQLCKQETPHPNWPMNRADVGWLIKQLRASRRFYGFCMYWVQFRSAHTDVNLEISGLVCWEQHKLFLDQSAYNLSGFGSVPPLWATHSSQVTCWSPLPVDSWEACGFEALLAAWRTSVTH